jgi:hypothetical protein
MVSEFAAQWEGASRTSRVGGAAFRDKVVMRPIVAKLQLDCLLMQIVWGPTGVS